LFVVRSQLERNPIIPALFEPCAVLGAKDKRQRTTDKKQALSDPERKAGARESRGWRPERAFVHPDREGLEIEDQEFRS